MLGRTASDPVLVGLNPLDLDDNPGLSFDDDVLLLLLLSLGDLAARKLSLGDLAGARKLSLLLLLLLSLGDLAGARKLSLGDLAGARKLSLGDLAGARIFSLGERVGGDLSLGLSLFGGGPRVISTDSGSYTVALLRFTLNPPVPDLLNGELFEVVFLDDAD
eukprot:CAMPEP_0201595018 /NCGR_PEP_ID=MMETSP0190_2-20130828/192160_1 /ASSEMBLY_ACC=CAM_ASM_000263 /TAXON_ID=37353 /ORGANISM="Rosalina sp." /LENGTH=161 /DNA_ID=CAMNT_0048054861 /DNA_START=715 /DNA_END=1200 /DNA_ORIENTATION=+